MGMMGEPRATALQPQQLGIGQLFARIRDAAVVVDVTTERIALWNPAAASLFGYDAAEAVGMPLARLVPASHRAAHQAGIARYRATGRGALIDGGTPITVPAARRDGTALAIELSLSRLDAVAVPGVFVLALIRDVTERQRLAAARLEQARLEGALLMIRTAEHEIATQLAGLSGLVELLARDPALPPHLRERAVAARDRAHDAAATLRLLMRLTHTEEQAWGTLLQPTIDLLRAARAEEATGSPDAGVGGCP